MIQDRELRNGKVWIKKTRRKNGPNAKEWGTESGNDMIIAALSGADNSRIDIPGAVKYAGPRRTPKTLGIIVALTETWPLTCDTATSPAAQVDNFKCSR
jgi:hypothetical protein